LSQATKSPQEPAKAAKRAPAKKGKPPKRAKQGLLGLEQKRNLTGWTFLIPAALLITVMSFWPMFKAFQLSLQIGKNKLEYADPLWYNYVRLFTKDKTFILTMKNTFLYLIIQVPIMLVLALILAYLLNKKDLRCRALFRTAIFLPCAISLVSYSMVFRTMFAKEGLVNDVLVGLNLLNEPINWLNEPNAARAVIILGLLWRWTGYNMIFYLAGLQNLDYATFEAAKIDGAGPIQTFLHVTIPQLRPMILLTAIMSTNGTLQLFDESYALTGGGPSHQTQTMSHYLFEVSFKNNSNFGYASAISFAILVMVAVLALIQMRVGDKRD
jgi:lactose/L-arabinose transport system permease protein